MLERHGTVLNMTDRGWTQDQVDVFIASLTEDERKGIDIVYGYGNVLTELPSSLHALPKVSGLYFGKNLLRRLPRDLPLQLRDLYLFENDLAALPSTMTRLTELRNLDLRGNLRLPERLRTTTYSEKTTREALTHIGKYYAQVEERHDRCRRVAVLMVALRRLHRSPYVVLIDIAVMRMVAAQVWSLRDVEVW